MPAIRRFSTAVGDHAVAASPLGPVKRSVSPPERGVQLFLLPVRPHDGRADADRDSGAFDRCVSDATAQAFGDLKRRA